MLFDKIPEHVLNSEDIVHFSKGLTHFRGVYASDGLPKRPRYRECGVLNYLKRNDDSIGHWTGYYKINSLVVYFDPFGLPPPTSVLKYFGTNTHIYYSVDEIQRLNEYKCGKLVLQFLFHVQDVLNKHL